MNRVNDSFSVEARYAAAMRDSECGRRTSPGRSSTAAYERLSQSNQGRAQILGVAQSMPAQSVKDLFLDEDSE